MILTIVFFQDHTGQRPERLPQEQTDLRSTVDFIENFYKINSHSYSTRNKTLRPRLYTSNNFHRTFLRMITGTMSTPRSLHSPPLHLLIHDATCRRLKPCPHCRRKVRPSHKSETLAENGNFWRQSVATVSFLCDSLTFLRQCGQGLRRFCWRLFDVCPALKAYI